MIYVCYAALVSRKMLAKSQGTGKYINVIRVSDYTIENGHVADTLCLDPILAQ